MSTELIFGIVLFVVGGGILYYFFKHIGDRPVEPKNYIEFHTINGKRVAYLHMADPPKWSDDDGIVKAFSEAMELLYHDPKTSSDDFQLAWNSYTDFLKATRIDHG